MQVTKTKTMIKATGGVAAAAAAVAAAAAAVASQVEGAGKASLTDIMKADDTVLKFVDAAVQVT